MDYRLDERGHEELLHHERHQVMMEWEKPYMTALIDALQPFGDVLEVGFGLGYSATQIQKYNPKSHTIIECDQNVLSKAHQWAAQHPSVTVVESTWQEALPKLGIFDAIFFDDFPLDDGTSLEWIEEKKSLSNSIIQDGNLLLDQIQKDFSFISKLRYTTQDLEIFCKTASQDKIALARFLAELNSQDQISDQQYDSMISQFDLVPLQKPTQKTFIYPDRTMEFLRLCLQSHMRKGSRFSAFSGSPVSKYENKAFFDEVIVNPDLNFKEFTIPIEVSLSCRYYKHNEALVFVIQKLN